jgi:hypothetical protein
MAAAIGRPTACSMNAHWPFGLTSRNTQSPSGVTRKSSAPEPQPQRAHQRPHAQFDVRRDIGRPVMTEI